MSLCKSMDVKRFLEYYSYYKLQVHFRGRRGFPVQCFVCGCVKGEKQVIDTENNESFRMVVSQSGSLLLLGGCMF